DSPKEFTSRKGQRVPRIKTEISTTDSSTAGVTAKGARRTGISGLCRPQVTAGPAVVGTSTTAAPGGTTSSEPAIAAVPTFPVLFPPIRSHVPSLRPSAPSLLQ